MVVAPDRLDTFFPNTYNEDWFFMLGVLEQQEARKQIAASGTVAQIAYDPFIRPERAREEEFGDCLGEGIFALLDDGTPLQTAWEHEYWEAFLADRSSLLDRILTAARELREPVVREGIMASIRVAQGRRLSIKPENCVKYLEAWRSDRQTWQRYLAKLQRHAEPKTALRGLGLRSSEER
jgi:hypothetical protein